MRFRNKLAGFTHSGKGFFTVSTDFIYRKTRIFDYTGGWVLSGYTF